PEPTCSTGATSNIPAATPSRGRSSRACSGASEMNAGRAILRAVVGAAMLCLSMGALAQPTDTAVKAAFLPRFARYVSWPPAAMPRGSDPFVLCVVGADPFGTALDEAARSQLIDGRRVIVRRMSSLAGVESCQIAFFGSRQFVGQMGSWPVLTVTGS